MSQLLESEFMKNKTLIVLGAIVVAFGWRVEAQTYDTNNVVVSTFAGSGFSGYVDGVGVNTMFNNPSAIVADSSSNLFVWDSGNSRVRKITPDGSVSTFAQISYYTIGSMTIDHLNALWLSAHDPSSGGSSGGYLYRIDSNANISSTRLNYTYSINGFHFISGVCVDSGNNIYYTDYYGNKIYRYKTNGVTEVFAGSGNSGSTDGNGIFTSFSGPGPLTADVADNIYVFDYGSQLIRRINQNRDVVTIAGVVADFADIDGVGTNASFTPIGAMCRDSDGNVILASGYHIPGQISLSSGSAIRKMNPATNVVTMAGSFSQHGYANGTGNVALFNNASGVCVSQGAIFVADTGNQRIRKITYNPQIVTRANLAISTAASVTISITGTIGHTYQIQSSLNMSTWTTNVTAFLTSSPYLWIDTNRVSGNKFYRAVMLP